MLERLAAAMPTPSSRDVDHDHPSVASRGDRDVAGELGIERGVAQEIGYHLREPILVRIEDEAGGHVDDERMAPLLEQGAHHLDGQ